MKRGLKVVAGIVLSFAILLGLVMLFIQNLPDVKEVNEFGNKLASVQIGDSENKVLSILGKPDAKEKEFRLGQKKGFEDAYARAEVSDSKYYLLWFRGIDVVFAVGINNKGQVSAKESGGT